MPEERPAAWGVHELCALMGSFCLGLFPWSRPRFPFRSRAPFFPALSTPLPGSRSRVLSSHGHGRSSSRRSLAAGRGLMQMTLTAVKEVILQLIERRRVPRQSVPFDTRPGARYSPWPEPEPRLLAGNTVNVCTLASPSTFPALIIFIPRNLGTERSIHRPDRMEKFETDAGRFLRADTFPRLARSEAVSVPSGKSSCLDRLSARGETCQRHRNILSRGAWGWMFHEDLPLGKVWRIYNPGTRC